MSSLALPNSYKTLIAAFAGLIVGLVAGRWWAGRPDAVADVRPALAAAKDAVRRKDWQHAHDSLLVALRLDPGNEAVFDTGCRFAGAAAGEEDDPDGLAVAILLRLDAALPYLPLERVAASRERLNKLSDRPPAGKPQAAGDPTPPPADTFATTDNLLRTAANPAVPLTARVRLLQEADGELAAVARSAAAGAAVDWGGYATRKATHDEGQKRLARELYKSAVEDADRLNRWRQEVKQFVADRDALTVPDATGTDAAAGKLLNDGQAILRDVTQYRDAEVPEAAAVLADGVLDRNLTRVIRSREWMYNRWAVAHIEKNAEAGERTPLDRAKSLALIDESRLLPYPAEQFAAAWKRWFDGCDSEGKVEATKARIMKGVNP